MWISELGLPTDFSQAAGDHPFGPPAPKPLPLWALVGGIVVLALATNLLHSSPQRPRTSPPPQVARPPEAPIQNPPTSTPLVIRGQSFEPPRSAERTIAKCVVDGRILSDNAKCTGSATSFAISGVPEMGTVGMSEYQRELSEDADARIAAQTATAPAGPSAIGGSTGRSPECAALDRDIQSLDAAARVLLSASQQNAIRTSRERARSRQFSLGC
jgi:hypothetical protein